MFRYGYVCDICGANYEDIGNRKPAPPVSLHTPEGHFQACPECANAETKRAAHAAKEKQNMSTDPDQLEAASERLAQIARKKRAAPEPEPEYDEYDDGESGYLEDEQPAPLHRKIATRKTPARRAVAPPPRRSRLSEAQDRFEAALEAFELAEDELIEAQAQLDEVEAEFTARRSRIFERYQTPVTANARSIGRTRPAAKAVPRKR